MKKERVVIIGSGPAGLTAALYTARAQLAPVVIAGNQLGGQVAITHEIENYPGFPDGLSGPELVERMKEHAENFGAVVEFDLVESVDFSNGSPFRIKTYGEEYLADAVIVTIGADPRKLGVPGEEDFIGAGVSYCGTCDGFFFRGKDIVVVGGGDSALEEGIFLTRFATSVNVIHRRDELRAGIQLQTRAFNNEKISFTWNSVVEEIIGDAEGGVKAVRLKNVLTGEETIEPTEGVFIFIGHDPNNAVFGDQIALNENGYIITDQRYRTNVEGVFAAGEIQDEIWRQVATSVGQGTSAAMSAIQWLEANEERLQALDALPAAGD
ncbi:MAG: thioredoxin-disulfide reductase [Chloroflexota bacterium]|nr:thioredoxin-disulfide reductase [Chloroflexota bacterium]MDE2951163.1 thioredoxin-disulfide reductase [Chloroflexota bacterium]